MIYLFGISRAYQVCAHKPIEAGGLPHYNYRHLAFEYERYLRDVVKIYQPQTIVEEFSWPLLSKIHEVDNEAFLVAKMVCLEMGRVEHKMLDSACHDECIELSSAPGVPRTIQLCKSTPSWNDNWFKEIRRSARENSLLVCCANHITSVRKLMDAMSYNSMIICDNFSARLSSAR